MGVLFAFRVTRQHPTQSPGLRPVMRSKGKQDATFRRLTSPGTPATLRGVGRSLGDCVAAVGGSTLWWKVWGNAKDSRLSR